LSLYQETDFSILFRLLTVLVSSHTYIIYKTTSCTTSSFVYLKSFKELSFLELPFQRESVCKGKAFFLSLQIFSKFFSKKFFRRTSRGLSVSRSLAVLQGKILGCSAFESLPLFTSLSSSAALPLESGCKGTHFFRFCNFYAILFCRNFEEFL
jgi:hypothetical protein